MNSISVIDEYYEETSENKEEVLNKIAINIDKMYAVPFVYRKEYSLAGIFNQSYGALGSEKWSRSLLDCVKSSFVVELKQIQEKHNDLYIQKLIDRFSFQPSKAKPTSIIDWLRSQF